MEFSKQTFKFKTLALIFVIGSCVWLMPTLSFALGIGSMQLDSTLNQKLNASVELLGVDSIEASNISVRLASDAIYARMGIEPVAVLKKLKFSIEQNDDGKFFVHVTTDEYVTEPFLNFLIELNWSHGRLLREFTLLLDPPVLLDEEALAIDVPKADLPATFTVTKNSSDTRNVKISQTADSDSLDFSESDDIALSEDSIDQMLNKILEDEAKALNLAEDDDSTFASDIAEFESTSEKVASVNTLVHERVNKNEILWNIAEKLRPENISVEQMMLALQKENANAFYGDNVSFLKAGAVLRIADTNILSDISAEEAVAEISRQHQDWLAIRRERQAKNAVAVESLVMPKHIEDEVQLTETVAGQELKLETQFVTQPRLKLVSPIDESDSDVFAQTNAVLSAATEKLSQLNIELSIANEAAEAGKHENTELMNRLSALEEQMSAMQSLIQLKDAELQRLQGNSVAGALSSLTPLIIDSLQAQESEVNITKVMQHEEHDNTNIMNDPLTIATGIIAVLLLILLAWIIRSRKERIVDEDELVYKEQSQKSLDELFPNENDGNVNDEVSVIKFNTLKTEDSESEISLEPLTEITFENTEILEKGESLLDPIAEADVYLTYEKYEKAKLLLQGAIEAAPDRQELKLKLLEVYALSRNIENFDEQAEMLYAAIGGDESHSIWQHALLMAEDINTQNPLFSLESKKIDPVVFESSEENESQVTDHPVTEFQVEKTSVAEDSATDIDENTSKSATVVWSPDQVTEFESTPKIILDNELKIENDAPQNDKVSVSDAELESAMNSFTDTVLDENWDGEKIHAIVNDAILNATNHSQTSNDVEKELLDDTLFLLSDEVGTKLDLAKAYMEMGDQEGALDLLAEVIEEGTTVQIHEAKELME